MSETFNAAVNWLLGPDVEGTHSDDAADRGGDTWYGISRVANPDMPWPPTRDQAIERYRERYWNACRCDELPPIIAVAVFDAAVQHDPKDAIRFLQRTIRVTIDGIIGTETIAHSAWADGNTLANFLSYRSLHYTKLTREDRAQMRFARGWARRLFLLQQFALSL